MEWFCGTNRLLVEGKTEMQIVMTAAQTIGLWRLNVERAIVDRMEAERGEGVISMAIAVLIVAFLGVALWLAFKGFADDTEKTLEDQVDKIGS